MTAPFRNAPLISWSGAAVVVTALVVGYSIGYWSGEPALELTTPPVASESRDDPATLTADDPTARDPAAGGRLESTYHAIFDKLENELDADRFARFYSAVRRWATEDGFSALRGTRDEYENAEWQHRVDLTGLDERSAEHMDQLVGELDGILTPEQITDFLRYTESLPARRTVDRWLASTSVVRPADESLEVVYDVMTQQGRSIRRIGGNDPTVRAKALGDVFRQVNAAVDERVVDVLTADQLNSFSKYRSARTQILELEVALIDPSRIPKLGYPSEY